MAESEHELAQAIAGFLGRHGILIPRPPPGLSPNGRDSLSPPRIQW